MNKDIMEYTLNDIVHYISIVEELIEKDIISIDLDTKIVTFNNNKVNKLLETQNLELKNQVDELLKEVGEN